MADCPNNTLLLLVLQVFMVILSLCAPSDPEQSELKGLQNESIPQKIDKK